MEATMTIDRVKFHFFEVPEIDLEFTPPQRVTPHNHYWYIPGVIMRKDATPETMIAAVEERFRTRAAKSVVSFDTMTLINGGKGYLQTTNRTRLLTDLRGILAHFFYGYASKGNSLAEVGKLLGRDHATVLHYITRHENLYGFDKRYTAITKEVYSIIDSSNETAPSSKS